MGNNIQPAVCSYFEPIFKQIDDRFFRAPNTLQGPELKTILDIPLYPSKQKNIRLYKKRMNGQTAAALHLAYGKVSAEKAAPYVFYFQETSKDCLRAANASAALLEEIRLGHIPENPILPHLIAKDEDLQAFRKIFPEVIETKIWTKDFFTTVIRNGKKVISAASKRELSNHVAFLNFHGELFQKLATGLARQSGVKIKLLAGLVGLISLVNLKP